MKQGIISLDDLSQARQRVQLSQKHLLEWWPEGPCFINTFSNHPLVASIESFISKGRGRFDTLVHCGVGGSVLGAQALIRALAPTANIIFLDNVDPMTLSRVEASLNLKKTLFHVVSKSGETTETLAHFKWACRLLRSSGCVLSDHVVVSSSAKKGGLAQEAKMEKLPFFEIPEAIGGRFSALTSVGLIPAAFAGLSIRAMLEGAQSVSLSKNGDLAIEMAAVAYVLHKKQGHRVAAFFIYSDFLELFGQWLTQLWSESLGKKKNLQGEEIYEGSFPLLGRGSPAQHSLLQLLMEGPKIAWTQFIEIEDFQKQGHEEFSRLMRIEARATLESLLMHGRPCVRVAIRTLDEASLGALFYWYQCVVSLLGLTLQINPFDQPGVEDSKKRIQLLIHA